MELNLKRGRGLSFEGVNWKSSGDSYWSETKHVLPNGEEQILGSRSIRGVDHTIFLCKNDTFFAQPTSICLLPKSNDPMEIQSPDMENSEEDEMTSTTKTTKTTPVKTPAKDIKQVEKILTFLGKNWKLASDKKWKEVTGFSQSDLGESVGTKTINKVDCDIYKASTGFIAIRKK